MEDTVELWIQKVTQSDINERTIICKINMDK